MAARRRAVLAIIVGLCVFVPSVLATASVEEGRRRVWTPANGVTLTRIRYETPNQVRVLRVDTSVGAGLDIRVPEEAFPGRAQPSAMANAQKIAIAGVNGDFTTQPGAAQHALLIDGELWTSGTPQHAAVAWNADGTRAFAGRPTLQIQLLGADGLPLFDVTNWNAPLSPYLVNGYSRRGGEQFSPPGVTEPKPKDPLWCAARLVPLGSLGWSDAEQTGIAQPFSVLRQPETCRAEPLGFGADPGAIVFAAQAGSLAGEAVHALTPGQTVSLRWSFLGWPGVTDVIGGVPLVVNDGMNVTTGFDDEVHPRTSLGLTAGCSDVDPATVCEFIVITVDGRQDRWSLGMTLSRLAEEHLAQGSWDAVNLDGGGSTVMWVRKRDPRFCRSIPEVRGCLVTQPSDGTERFVTSALTVIRHLDPETPISLGGIPPAP
jgi:hypothetical protein